jgi:hypothetical protein
VSPERQVLRFLQSIEAYLPPPTDCHHNLTVVSGVLTLSVRYGSHWHTFFLDEWNIESEKTIKYVVAAVHHTEANHA